MDLNYVRKLIKLLAESGVDEIEIEEEGKSIRLAKHSGNAVVVQHPTYPAPGPSGPAPSPVPPLQSSPERAPEAVLPSSKFQEVRSPIVGTFYRSPAPDAAPFVNVGSTVEAGTVLCIVEAMKLMNEIESDVAGKVAKVLVDNGRPVEYDQVLFLIEKA